MNARVWDVAIDGKSVKLGVGENWYVVIPDSQLGMREVSLAKIAGRTEKTVELEWVGWRDGEEAELKARFRIDDVEWLEKHPGFTVV